MVTKLHRYRADGSLSVEMHLDESIRDVDVFSDKNDRTFILQACCFDEDDNYVAARMEGDTLRHFRFGSMLRLGHWGVCMEGRLWAFGYTKENKPILVEAASGKGIMLPLPEDEDLLRRCLLFTRDGRVLLSTPLQDLYCGVLADVARNPKALVLAG